MGGGRVKRAVDGARAVPGPCEGLAPIEGEKSRQRVLPPTFSMAFLGGARTGVRADMAWARDMAPISRYVPAHEGL